MGLEIAGAVALAAVVAAGIVFKRSSGAHEAQPAAQPAPIPARVTSGAVEIVRPNPSGVEGLEVRYGPDALVRAVRVGAMNCEHKELLLTMDDVRWSALPNAQKQEVLAAARSTWAAKMCEHGPDIAYVVMQTERGEIVGRADPHSVRVL